MIVLKTRKEIEGIRKACQISAEALRAAGNAVRPGVSTAEIDRVAREYVESCGAVPNFLNYGGFPGSACISVNDEIIHGIPSKDRILQEGDIVSIDMGAMLDGFHGDNAATFPVGKVSDEAMKLIETTRESLYEGIKAAVGGARIGDIGHAVQKYCEDRGFTVIREYTGHGVGKRLHEDPAVPNYGTPGRGHRLTAGMTIAIEPMVNEGAKEIIEMPDGWTVKTKDGKLSAHFEHTVLITKGEAEILTLCRDE